MTPGPSINDELDGQTQRIILFLLKDNAFDEQFLLTTIQEYITRSIERRPT